MHVFVFILGAAAPSLSQKIMNVILRRLSVIYGSVY